MFIFKMYARALAVIYNLIPKPYPVTLTGRGSIKEFAELCCAMGWEKPLLVTDAVLNKLGVLDPLKKILKKNRVGYAVYDGVTPDPRYRVIEEAYAVYRKEGCGSVIAVGGGSVIDTAKVVKLMPTHNKRPAQFVGLFKAKNRGVPFAAAPTTAGTGSEATLGAVLSDDVTHQKGIAADPRLVPDFAVLDPDLTMSMPPRVTASTAIDALTHAIEAYVGENRFPEIDAMARAAVKIIYEYLEKVYRNGKFMEGRYALLKASFLGGICLNKGIVGYVHAIAHNLGRLYDIPHGLGNAVALPLMMEYYLDAVPDRLAELGRDVGLEKKGDGTRELARKFIESLHALNRKVGIPPVLEQIREEDVDNLVRSALREAHAGPYPVPRYMNRAQCEAIVRKMMKPKA